jgi:hypothetical protein
MPFVMLCLALRLTEWFGSEIAKRITDDHELDDMFNNPLNVPKEDNMDLYKNDVGREEYTVSSPNSSPPESIVPLDDGMKASNGFAALAALDTNHDGVFNSEDTQFGAGRVWRDARQRSVCHPGGACPGRA